MDMEMCTSSSNQEDDGAYIDDVAASIRQYLFVLGLRDGEWRPSHRVDTANHRQDA
jgi:hypothetical protein